MLLTLVGCDAGGESDDSSTCCTSVTDDDWERATTQTPLEQHGQLTVVGSELRDENGDQVQLKGVSSMWLNWETDGYAESDSAIEWMRDEWNLSVIRAAMGVEPSGAYLSNPEGSRAQVARVVEGAVAAGVYVIVDWHDHNALNHEEEAAAFFTDIAAEYGEHPNVIYELFNEPLAVSWGDDLKPYHEHLVATIREIDPDNLIVLGTPSWSQGVDAAAADPVDGENLLYTLHFYSCSHGWLISQALSAQAAGLPIFVTEWGATTADGGLDGQLCLREAEPWLNWMSDTKVSWTAWKLDACPDSTCLLAAGSPVGGGWTSQYLAGHAPFVRDRMRLP